MTNIGQFTKQEDTTLIGSIKTLTLNLNKVIFKPLNPTNDKHPDYQIMINGIEIGAAWERTSKKGNRFLNVNLDDPSFVMPIYAKLYEQEQTNQYDLVWSRN